MYGKAITKEYGWAEIALEKKQINFRDLEQIADQEYRRAETKFASMLIHANRVYPQQLLGYPEWQGCTGPLIGPSPYGIRYALNESVATLLLLTMDVASVKFTIDTIVLTQIAIENKNAFDRALRKSDKFMSAYTEGVDSNWAL
jgi:hypothetical protein